MAQNRDVDPPGSPQGDATGGVSIRREPVIGLPETWRQYVAGEVWRTALGALFTIGTIVETTTQHRVRGYTWEQPWPWVDVALGCVALVLLHWRRARPVAVTLTIAVLTAASVGAQGAWFLALASLATHRRWLQTALVSVVGLAASTAHVVMHPTLTAEPFQDVLPSTIAVVVSIALSLVVGLYVGARRELMAHLRAQVATVEREQSLRIAQARVSERARIAREMHDVLAHRISVVAMHSGVLGYRDDLTPDEVRHTAEIIQTNAHEALVELRGVLGVLRGAEEGRAGEDGRGAEEPPQPTLGDLPALAKSFRDAGQRVDLVIQAPYDELDAAVSRSAYRIVQESLTNAAKHAPGEHVVVTVRGRAGDRLTVEVRNPIRTETVAAQRDSTIRPFPSSGMGLIGLTERAVLTGGELRHGEYAGWFVVSAWLPWAARPTASSTVGG